MFRWLVRQFSSAETATTQSFDSAKTIRALVTELNAAPADQAVRTLNERFEEILRQGLSAPNRRALRLLDEYAQLRLTENWESLLTGGRGQSVSDVVWHMLITYYRNVHKGYWLCLETYSDAEPIPARDHNDAIIIASRAMTALARQMLLLRMRYRNPPKDVWSHVNNLAAWVERRGKLTAQIEQYPATGVTTTVEHELLAALLIEMAPTANLLPAQMLALDRLLRPYASYYSFSDTHDEQARPFAYEPSRNESPRRWLRALPERPGVRFFGIGGAYLELSQACDDAKTARTVPQWIAGTRCTADDYRDLLERLVADWSQHPPSRNQRREPSPGEILVAHDWADIRRLVTFGELAKLGRSLMYDGGNVHWTTDTTLRSRSGVVRELTAEEILLANLRSFEQSLHNDATDLWSLSDSSERGIGATAAATCAWVKVGMLIAFRRADSIEWQVALVRRINFTTNHRLSVGMTRLPGTVHAGRLRLGVERLDYSKSINTEDPIIEHDAIVMLHDTLSTLLLPIGVIDSTLNYTLHWNNRQDIVKMEKPIDRGLNFERVEISGLRR